LRLIGERRRMRPATEALPSNEAYWAAASDLKSAASPSSLCCESGARRPEQDISFALSWDDEAVQAALLSPSKNGIGELRGITSIGVQTEAPQPSSPVQSPGGAMQTGLHSPMQSPMQGGSAMQGPMQASLPVSFMPNSFPQPAGRSRSRGSRRSSRGSGTAPSISSQADSESSMGSSAGALGPPTIASCFRDTSLVARRKSIIIAMHHWNIPRNPEGCCPWHEAVCAVEEIVKLEAMTPCKPLWSPFLGWQCIACTCVNHPTVAPCNVCGADRPAAAMRYVDAAAQQGVGPDASNMPA